jgi:N-terminal acetyltransferase 2
VQKTLSGRLKTLIKTYGWYALGVYIVFSTLDFGVAFIAINLLGADQVSYMAASIKSFLFDLIGRTPPAHPGEPDNTGHPTGGSEGLYAMIVLAYTVHKTLFLPIRVGLTAAFTPKFVNWLGKRGWAGTDGARRAGREIRERVKRSSRESNSP